MQNLDDLRLRLRRQAMADEAALVAELARTAGLSEADRAAIAARAQGFVERLRARPNAGLVEGFLARFPLGSREGMALMGLAEALSRVPDAATLDALIADKIEEGDWRGAAGEAGPLPARFAALSLAVAAGVLDNAWLRGAGRPVIRAAAKRVAEAFGGQFVFARMIDEAMRKARPLERRGYRFSYDMLGEAAFTGADADRYFARYGEAVQRIGGAADAANLHDRPGISVKLSALHPRYDYAQRKRVGRELAARAIELARAARDADIGMTIDAEESERLDLSLDIVSALAADRRLAGWEGLGFVVQAYSKRALPLIDWADALAGQHRRRLAIRLVKGAYWDTEIKRAQVLGLSDYPVFTRKSATDVSYLAAARSLLGRPALYPQFATHNAHTAAGVLHLARQAGVGRGGFELQRLHGMGAKLHELLWREEGIATRIYAPVGPHRDLFAYLVRRLIENGASASFVQQVARKSVPIPAIVADPIDKALEESPSIVAPADLFASERRNSKGIDLADPLAVAALDTGRAAYFSTQWRAAPLIGGAAQAGQPRPIANPARQGDIVGICAEASEELVGGAVAAAEAAFPSWSTGSASGRAARLRAASDLYETHGAELVALLIREAGKSVPDAVAELREAVDFLRYYAGEAERHAGGAARGVFACISPWNFPLAIFTGQIAAALAAGNTVVAKPVSQTPLIGHRAVELLHEAGIPAAALNYLPGDGPGIGGALTRDPRIVGVAFTGSLLTARRIEMSMAAHLAPDAPLIAETGGINAMVVDSTALPEQVVRDTLTSAFRSAGQRCSALRMLYLQEHIAAPVLDMLKGAMDELRLGDPWDMATDVGPVIDAPAAGWIRAHVDAFAARGRLLHRVARPENELFVAPTLLEVSSIAEIGEEVFGPVLHVASFRAGDFRRVIADINATGYGLTFALHSRISARARELWAQVHTGNIYVNRNQIGAVVGSQPFGGEGLSGTGPKAGGPYYLPRFQTGAAPMTRLEPEPLPGPTGESNILYRVPRGRVLCLGPGVENRERQMALARRLGNEPILPPPGFTPEQLATLTGVEAVAFWSRGDDLAVLRRALSRREGPLIALMSSAAEVDRLLVERHVCIDETAAGGDARLLEASV